MGAVPDRPSYPVSRLDYVLPPELIAQQPLPSRSASRLLYLRVAERRFDDMRFADLPGLLPPRSLIVVNNSRVILARLYGARQATAADVPGGQVEVLFLRYLADGECEAVVGSNARLKRGEVISLPGGWQCTLLAPKSRDGTRVRYAAADGHAPALDKLLAYLGQYGLPPLPPYIKRAADEEQALASREADRERYQTVYASTAGSAAAPTAGLHFDEAMLARLTADGHRIAAVTLHVGLGTFAPIRAADLRDHELHEEAYTADEATVAAYEQAWSAGQPVLAVGTTSLRVLHTLRTSPGTPRQAMTRAFIYPGHGTDACDLLLTNFHLPRSTLLALVYAFGGEELMRSVYHHAVEQRYRFYSYGDCMLIDRRGEPR